MTHHKRKQTKNNAYSGSPKISIIIPVYNVEKYLKACLESVLDQTFPNFEAICVNDGSTDSSESILKEYAKKDKRIKMITQENKGAPAARNAGLEKMTGSYVAFLDSDDMMHPQFLEEMLQAILETQLDFVWCDYQECGENDVLSDLSVQLKRQHPQIHDQVLDGFLRSKIKPSVLLWNKLYKATLFQDLKFEEVLRYAEDDMFTCQALHKAKKAAHIPMKLIFYRQRGGSLMHSGVSEKRIENYLQMTKFLTIFFKDEILSPKTRRRLNRRLARICLYRAIHFPKLVDKKNYRTYWEKFSPVLSEMEKNGFYDPSYFGVKSRLKSFLFTRQHFQLLDIFLKI